jgi:hypothetical protein
MRSRVIVGTTLLLLGLFAPNAPAAADPITITGGVETGEELSRL